MNVPAILWEHSMQRFLIARIAEVEYDDAVFIPACDVQEAGGGAVPDEIIAATERLTDARCDAEDALILTPTNDAANVRWKLAYCRIRYEDFCDFPDDWWQAIYADLERIATERAA
ncbi:MAG TPA: hypothetical protein VN047_05800 [Sphingopyxis sp.]|uniref:hypothetical protein n=1 Tax=Sphingopyxis sp. TaxID=1908224 RepID=UPI002B53FBDD|nr:hypothetical protein [Sphingopyxis sp.]HWW56385.1 hypothetical protein [Sphingopyxis sp.]